jgi:hypothetical protein
MSLRDEWGPRARLLIDEYYRAQGDRRWHRLFIKRKPVLLRSEGKYVHGIDEPRWQELRDQDGDLFIFEAESKTLLVQSIARLREAIDNTTPANNAVNFGNNMVFWARNTFEEVNGKPMQIRLL